MVKRLLVFAFCAILLVSSSLHAEVAAGASSDSWLYLSMMLKFAKAGGAKSTTPTKPPTQPTPTHTPTPTPRDPTYRVNAPYFNVENVLIDRFSETAVFWFGKITPTENAMDVRVGYNDLALFVRVAVYDRLFWYDPSPTPAEMVNWDSVSLYLNTNGSTGDAPGQQSFHFIGQLSKYETRDAFQAVSQGNQSGGWSPATLQFVTRSGWRGEGGFNTGKDNRGWTMSFLIPFEALGLSGKPADGVTWGMALEAYDRDDANGDSILVKTWPGTPDLNRPSSWGELRYGLITYTPPASTPGGAVDIRQEPGGAVVVDGAVGGGFQCGEGLEFWSEWGEYVDYLDPEDATKERTGFNVCNEADIADWPCFSKYFTIFPLDTLPAGKVIRSATLTMYQFGSMGDVNDPNPDNRPKPTLIQILTIDRDFDETTLNFNNAPLARENVAATWVAPTSFPGWPGIPYEWDITSAVAEAYRNGQPLRIAVYTADSNYHSGRYFSSSDANPDWNLAARPNLHIEWGNP